MRACSVTSVMSNSLQPYGWYPTRLLCPWGSPGKNTGVCCHTHLKEGLTVLCFLSICWSGEVCILFISEWYFPNKVFLVGSFLFQHLKYIISLSPDPLGFCWEICLEPNEGFLVSFMVFVLFCFVLAYMLFPHAAFMTSLLFFDFCTLLCVL